MENLRDIFIVGFSLFFAGAVVTAASFIYFLFSTRKVLRSYSRDEYKFRVAKTVYIYLMLFNACLAFGLLYVLQYYGMGFGYVFGIQIVIWMRWLFYVVVGGVYVGVLAYVMTAPPHGAQSLFTVLLYCVAMFSLFAGSVAQKREAEIFWALFFFVWFIQAIVCLFWPLNKITGCRDFVQFRDIVFSEPKIGAVMFSPKPNETESAITLWAFIYRLFMLVQLLVSHAGLIITWFLSDSQNFSTVSDLHATFISYLVFDCIFLLPLAILFCFLSARGVIHKYTRIERATGHKHIGTNIST